MIVPPPIRKTLRKIPYLRNRRYGFQTLRYCGLDLYDVSPFSNLSLIARNEDLKIVDEVFQQRRYATLFPFHQTATILDVGAHCGYFSVFAGKNSAEDSRIIGFEPNAKNRELARKNLDRNGLKNIELYPQGVSGKTGSIPLYTKVEATAQHSVIFDSKTDTSGEEEIIEVLALADLFARHKIDKCDFMKLDCEGAEYSFLYEAPPEVLNSITTISMEFHDLEGGSSTGTELAEFLVSQNYSLVDFRYEPTSQNRNYGTLLATRKW